MHDNMPHVLLCPMNGHLNHKNRKEHTMSDILVILGHPDVNSYCAALADAYVQGARAAGARVKLVKLAELDFDPVLHQGYNAVQELEPDLEQMQREISAARHVVWVYPMWWVGAPALLKGFVDRTFLPGWAFKYEGHALPTKLLTGRSARVIMTMDSPSWWYVLGYRRAATHSFQNGTLAFSGFAPVKATNIQGVQAMSPEQREAQIERARAQGGADVAKFVGASRSTPAGALT